MSTMLKRDPVSLPGHMDLPDTDGKPLENSIEQIQNLILTSSLRPILDQLHPDEQYFIGHDVGIFYHHYPEEPLKNRVAFGTTEPGIPVMVQTEFNLLVLVVENNFGNEPGTFEVEKLGE